MQNSRTIWLIAVAGFLWAAFCFTLLWRVGANTSFERAALAVGVSAGLLFAAAPLVVWWKARARRDRR